jgi:hypothetical protein
VGLRTAMDDVERRKSCLYLDLNSNFLAVQSITNCYIYCSIPGLSVGVVTVGKVSECTNCLLLFNHLSIVILQKHVKKVFTHLETFWKYRRKGLTLTLWWHMFKCCRNIRCFEPC